MDIIYLTLFCIAATVVMKLLGAAEPVIKLLCTVAAVCLVAVRFINGFRAAADSATDLFESAGIDTEYIVIIFKCLGICFTAQLGCDCCRDCGENALASQLELAGKTALIITALPLFRATVEIVRSLIMV